MQEGSENTGPGINLWQILRNRYGIILLTLLLVLLTVFVITESMDEEYLSTVELQVQEDTPDHVVFERSLRSTFNSYRFLETQFEIITSRNTLEKVIDDLGLMEKWGLPQTQKGVAFRRLKGMIDAKAKRNTELIEIEVYARKADLAADIANSIARNYQKRREELLTIRNVAASEQIERKLAEATRTMEQAQARMLDVVEKYKIVDHAPGGVRRGAFGGSQEAVLSDKSLLIEQERELLRLSNEISTLKANLTTLADLEGEDLVRKAAALEIADEALQRQYAEYQELQRVEQALLDSGLGARHPNVIMNSNQIEKLREQCVSAASNYQDGLRNRLAIAEEALNALQSRTDDQKEKVIDTGRSLVEYNKARHDYDTELALVSQLRTKLEMLKVDESMPRHLITLHQEAEANPKPAKPNKWFNMVLGAGMGLLLGLGLALFLEFADSSVKSIEDVEQYLGVPVLAVVPNEVGILHRQSGASPDAEAYRILRTNIEFNRRSQSLNAITVVSGGASEGKSTTLVNLAYICAQGGYTTLLVDADLRRPRLHTMFDINNSVGLTNYLTTDVQLEDVVLQTPIDNLYFLPSGILPADAAGILNSRRMSELMADVKSRFDLVLVDSPPILGVSDASVIASEVDHAIIVIQYRKLPKKMLLRVKQALDSVGCNILGAVLNNVDIRSDSQYQYYTSYYTYYSPSKASESAAVETMASYNEEASSVSQPVPGPPAGGDERNDDLY